MAWVATESIYLLTTRRDLDVWWNHERHISHCSQDRRADQLRPDAFLLFLASLEKVQGRTLK